MKTKRIILFIYFIFQISFGQTKNDSIKKPLADIISKNSFRVGVVLQNNLSSEIGFARHRIVNPKIPYCAYRFAPQGLYSSLEWISKSENYKSVYALKVGYEIDALFYSIAIEAKYQTNFDSKDFVITPKLGLGATRLYSVFYGYNISTNANPFGNVGRHQFSLIFNLNKGTFAK